tara:strand:+ start:322 stop:2628 length:2307 start_codon:yes stop_codon:yes gene_type:complete
MDSEQIKDYDFENDHIPPTMVHTFVRSHDALMDDLQPEMALIKSTYMTNFWKYVEGTESKSSNYNHELARMDQVEVNRLKPALSGYLSSLYPRRIEVVIGNSPYTTGDPDKAEMVVNDWLNQPRMRDRILSASRQALLYKGAGAKIGYDSAGEGLDRVWMRVFPYWEMMLDSDCHDWDDARYVGHISFRPRQQLIEEYGLDDDIGGTGRDDFLSDTQGSNLSYKHKQNISESEEKVEYLRVLEFTNLVDDFYDMDGTRYKGRLEVYILNEGDAAQPVYMGPLPLVDPNGKPMSHIVPLIFEHEPEYPFRGIAYAQQLMPQQKEINALRSFVSVASRRDSRVYLARRGVLDAEQYSDLKSGEDGLIVEVDDQFAGNLKDVVVPINHGPISMNIMQSMQLADADIERQTTLSPAALGMVTKATAEEVRAVERHTESEFGRHAEQRDLWLLQIVQRSLAAYVASMYDSGDSEGAEQDKDLEGVDLENEELQEKRDDEGLSKDSNESTEIQEKDEDESEEKEELQESEFDKEELQESEEKPTAEPERKDEEEERVEKKTLLLRMPDGETIEVNPEDLDSDFDIGFAEAGRTPAADAELRQNLVALMDKIMSLYEMMKTGGPMSVMAEEMLRSLHERFELPPNLHPDYLKGKETEAGAQPGMQPPPGGMPPGPGPEEMAAPPGAAPPGAPPGPPVAPPEQPPETGAAPPGLPPEVDQLLESVLDMAPLEALNTLEQLFAEEPAALKVISEAKALPPEQQAEAVALIVQTARGQ